jgi:hypothetical protein
VAVPLPQAARFVQAVPPLKIRHLRLDRPKQTAARAASAQAPRSTFVPRSQATVVHVTPARRMLKAHRVAVIRKLAPTAPLVRARVLAAIAVQHHAATPKHMSPTAKTIAALAASLSKR